MLPSKGQLSSGRKSALAALWYEVGLLERLLYKNKNQHRHTLHFQRLQQVHRILMIVRRSSIATPALEGLLGSEGDGAALTVLSSRDPQRGLGLLRLLEQLLLAIEAASKALGALLAQSFFMPFALTVLACLARIHTIASQAADSLKGRGKTATGELEAAREKTAPISARNLDSRLSSGTPPPVQPLPEGPVYPVSETLQAAVVLERSETEPEMGPPGFSGPRFDLMRAEETGIQEGVSQSPAAKRVRLSEEARGSGESTGGAIELVREGTSQERGFSGSVEGGLPTEPRGIPFISNEDTPRSETSANPVIEAEAKADESERKKRAAAWLEDLGLEARTPHRDTCQSETGSTGLQRHRKSGPLQGTVTKVESKVGDLASDLLAGTDFEGFGGSESVGRVRGKKRMKGRKV